MDVFDDTTFPKPCGLCSSTRMWEDQASLNGHRARKADCRAELNKRARKAFDEARAAGDDGDGAAAASAGRSHSYIGFMNAGGSTVSTFSSASLYIPNYTS